MPTHASGGDTVMVHERPAVVVDLLPHEPAALCQAAAALVDVTPTSLVNAAAKPDGWRRKRRRGATGGVV